MYCISIYGCFSVFSAERSFRIARDKEKALITVLCLSPNFKRSRRWLSSLLWGENTDERANANLRQAIWRIRSEFKGYYDLLEADSDNVWLRQDAVSEIPPSNNHGQDLLEGIIVDEEAFEDWLRLEKSGNYSRGTLRLPESQIDESWTHSRQNLPQVAIFPSVALSDAVRITSDHIVDIVVKTLVEQKCVEVFDLRHSQKPKFEPLCRSPAFGLVPRLFYVDGQFQFSLTMKNLATGHVLWTRCLDEFILQDGFVAEGFFSKSVAEIANAIHDQIYHHCTSIEESGMFTAIQGVISHTKDGINSVRPWLVDAASESGLARAWLMYTYAVAHAERYGGLEKQSLEELQNHCRLALQAEPANPIVRAIIGHINAFVFRAFDEAETHHKVARKLGWNHPIVWTLSAMFANYTNRPKSAYEFSAKAMAQSQFSPNRFYFEGPHSICCTLTNRHEEAITIGSTVLSKKPGFLAAMRHLTASQAILGRIDDARSTIRQIRRKDAQFVRSEIRASDYPLPSAMSVKMIDHALRVVEA